MNPRHSNVFFQIFAVCLALGMGGTYVWSRAKQAQPGTEAPAVPSPTNVEQIPLLADAQPSGQQQSQLPNSKGQPPTTVEDSGKPGPQKSGEQRVIMAGSKSDVPVFPPATPAVPPQRAIISGSKSMTPIFVAPNASTTGKSSQPQTPQTSGQNVQEKSTPVPQQPTTPKERAVLSGSKSMAPIIVAPKPEEAKSKGEQPVQSNEQTTKSRPERGMILPGSKSGPIDWQPPKEPKKDNQRKR